MMETRIPEGSIVTFESGAYSDTRVSPPLKAKSDVDLKTLYIIYLNTLPDYVLECEMENSPHEFQQWLETSGYFEPIPCDLIPLGQYSLEPAITAGNESHIERLRQHAINREEARMAKAKQRQEQAEHDRLQKIVEEATKLVPEDRNPRNKGLRKWLDNVASEGK